MNKLNVDVNVTKPQLLSHQSEENSYTGEKTRTYASNATINHSKVQIIGKGNSSKPNYKRAIGVSQI